MLISIVVPIYNVEQYLKDCVESVLKQTYPDWELILVDDGSKDNCPAICDEYARQDRRIKVVHKVNGGLVSARKAGLEVARGDYVMPLDGDDFIDDNCLGTIVRIINQEEPDVVCFGYNIYCDGQITANPIEIGKYGFLCREDMEKYIFPAFLHGKDERQFPHNLWAKVFEKEMYSKYQKAVSSSIGMGEDGACTYPLIFNANSIVILEECFYYYRQVNSSMTKAKKPLSWDNYDLVYKVYREKLDLSKYDMLQQYYRARTHNLFNIVLSQFYVDKKYAEIVAGVNARFAAHPEYDEAIMKSSFSSLPMKLSHLVLKYKCFFILYLISNNKDLLRRLLSFK